MEALGTVAQCVPALRRRQAATHCVPCVRLVQRPRRHRRRLINTHSMLPIAVDAMGGDRAPSEILAGAHAAAALGIPVVLVGPEDLEGRGDLELIVASEIIAMDEDAAKSVRRKKDSTLVRAAEAVRDGKASAMVSAGNTGATMASALLRMGRIKGVNRPAIATPIPVPGSTPTILLDAGANAEVQPEWLVQFGQMGSVYARHRFGIEHPSVGLAVDRRGARQGRHFAQRDVRAAARTRPASDFVGNVEGRDIMTEDADVVVTDGFTGNVVLKALEGGLRAVIDGAARSLRGRRALQAACRRAAAGAAAPVRPARPRHLRRRDAAGCRRRVHHQPRLVQLAGDAQRDQARPGDGRTSPGRRDPRPRSPPTSKPLATLRGPRSASLCLLTPPRSVNPCLPRPMSNKARSTAMRSSRSSATDLADILEIEPATISEGQSFVDDLDADSLALIELVEALEEELGERSVGFRIEDEDLEDLKTVRDAVDYVYDRVREA